MEKNQVILQRVQEKLEKSGEKFAKPQGKLYLELKRIYLIFALYLLIMNVFFLISGIAALGQITEKTSLILSMISVAVCSAVIVAAYCCINKFKFHLTSGVVSVLSSTTLLLYYGSIYTDKDGFLGFKDFYFWRFFIPLVVMIVLFSWLTVIAVRARGKINLAYKKYVDNLYNEYTEKNGTVTYGEWEEYLKNYTLENRKSEKKDAR